MSLRMARAWGSFSSRSKASLCRNCWTDGSPTFTSPAASWAPWYFWAAPIVASVPRFRRLGYRVLVGASRKAFVGRLTGVEHAADRVFGSIGAALAAAEAGADVIRVHDVRATREALAVYLACRSPT